MGFRVNQSTIPSFNTENSIITNMVNNTILFCQSFNTERRNFVVVDESGLIGNGNNTSVQTAFNNGWIVDFPNTTAVGYKEKYIFAFTGADYADNPGGVYNSVGFTISKYMLRNKGKFLITKNGLTLPDTDWDFYDVDNLSHKSAIMDSDIYSTSIVLNSNPANTDLFIIEYTEEISLGASYNIKLYRTNSNETLKATMIPKSLHYLNTFNCYNRVSNGLDDYTWNITYTNINNPAQEWVLNKRYPERFRISEFPRGFDLSTAGLELEVYETSRNWNREGDSGTRTLSNSNNTRIVYRTTNNDIHLDNFRGQSSGTRNIGTYKFRFRYINDNTFSQFFNTSIKIKQFPVLETDQSLSLSNCVGYCKIARIV